MNAVDSIMHLADVYAQTHPAFLREGLSRLASRNDLLTALQESTRQMVNDATPKVYLSRRNLLTLLSKLDRQAESETNCTLIKHKGTSPEYQQTMKSIAVVAVEDEDYYASQGRPAGIVHPLDDPARF